VRLVLDTNVLLAAFLARGVCHDLFAYCVRAHQIVLSNFLQREVRGKLETKFRVPKRRVDDVIELLSTQFESVEVPEPPDVVYRDRDDDWVLATARVGQVRWLVTGDQDLLAKAEHAGIRIVSPADFWALEAQNVGEVD
jgi:putative PIN family toxin of toxin-antitoxin system